MLGDISLGQFFPGDSFVHKLDPRFKIVFAIFYIVTIFCAASYASFALVTVMALALIAVSKINPRIILKSMKPVLFILIFTAIMNVLFTGGETLLVSFWVIDIYLEGIRFALLMALRIILLVTGAFVLLTYTTSPMALTDAIERLTSPLSKIGIPTHEFAMMMSIALRFIPTLIEETEKIISAQKARGADFETGSLLKRAKAFVPILIPLFISSFRRADELASAMECRLYNGGAGRTRLKVLKSSMADWAALAGIVVILCAVIYLNTVFARII